MTRFWPWAGALLFCGCLLSTARAAPLVHGPNDPQHDKELQQKVDGFHRQIHQFLTVPLGWGLEAFSAKPANRKLITDFLASGKPDFKAFSGKHPYEVLDKYWEFEDLGMFGGVQAAGDAFRYRVLRDAKAPAGEVQAAREILLRAMKGMHWHTQITGKPGIVARGMLRIKPEVGEPKLPGELPTPVPLFDAQGNPQPAKKDKTFRKDQSGKLPFLIWYDDCSKDQLLGYVFAMGAVYDAVAKDPDIPKAALEQLRQDA